MLLVSRLLTAHVLGHNTLGAMPSRRRDHLRDTQAVYKGFLCKHCDDLLEEAVQTEEGVRLCKICYDTIARSVNSFIGMFYT